MKPLAEVAAMDMVKKIAKSIDEIFAEAMTQKGYPMDDDYLDRHITKRDRGLEGIEFFHDHELFLVIKPDFDLNKPNTIQISPYLY